MRLNKKIQNLMPYGKELILQGQDSKPDIDFKLIIRKRFKTQAELDNWLSKKRDVIKHHMIRFQMVCDG